MNRMRLSDITPPDDAMGKGAEKRGLTWGITNVLINGSEKSEISITNERIDYVYSGICTANTTDISCYRVENTNISCKHQYRKTSSALT